MSGFNIELIGNTILPNQNGQQISKEPLSSANSSGAGGQEGASSVSFADLLKDTVAASDVLAKKADGMAEELIAGTNKNIHGTMLAMEKADISFRLLMQVRNKMVDAYREIMRMQV